MDENIKKSLYVLDVLETAKPEWRKVCCKIRLQHSDYEDCAYKNSSIYTIMQTQQLYKHRKER